MWPPLNHRGGTGAVLRLAPRLSSAISGTVDDLYLVAVVSDGVDDVRGVARPGRLDLEHQIRFADVEVLHGIEANIDAEGAITTDDDTLADLDLVVASPHSALGQDSDAATERLIRAVEHPHVDVLGHPTGRIINSRPGLAPDVEAVVEAAAAAGTAIEVNANPARLDADGDAVRAAIDAGATIAVNTDAHAPRELDNVRYGAHTARRGWAEAADVLNARSPDEIREFLDD